MPAARNAASPTGTELTQAIDPARGRRIVAAPAGLRKHYRKPGATSPSRLRPAARRFRRGRFVWDALDEERIAPAKQRYRESECQRAAVAARWRLSR